MRRREFIAGFGSAAAWPVVARAQTYPTRPVRIIVGFGPGGVTDIVARLIAQSLSERLGQQFVVENRPGAGSNIATEAAVRSPADGYTLLLCGSWNAWNATLYESRNFNFIRDITPVASITRGWAVMEVNPSFPAKTVSDFIAYAKENPGKVNMAAVPGGTTQLYGEMFKVMAGVDIVPVYYRGTAPAMTDLIAGQVHVMFDSLVSSLEHIRAGELGPLAVTSPGRLEVLPGIPTVGEFVHDYEATAYTGIGVPKNTSQEIVDKLNREINSSLVDPRMKARLVDLGYEPFALSPTNFRKLLAEETDKWGRTIRAANIKAQ